MGIKQLQSKKSKENKYWANIDVAPGDLHKHPTITPILLNSIGKIEAVIEVLRGSSNKIALEIVELWDKGNKTTHKILPIEAYALAVKSDPKTLMGIIMQAVLEQSQVATELMLAAAHPEVIKTTIKQAKKPKGLDDRKVVLQNRGTMPAPKNQVFNNYGNVDNRKQIANVSVGQLDTDADSISDAAEKFNSSRQLKSVDPEPIDFVDVTVED